MRRRKRWKLQCTETEPCPSPPRLGKAGTSISTQATAHAGTFRRVWGPKEGKEKHPQRWQVAPLPLPTSILYDFFLLSSPSLT